VIINTVAQSNPERAKAMAQTVQAVAQTVQQAQAAQDQYQAQQHAAQQQQWAAWSKAHDDAFEAYFSTVASPAEQAEIRKEALAMLHEDGMSDADIAALWESPAFRSVTAQKALMNAARYRMAQGAARAKAIKPVPIVQRPGSPLARGSEVDFDLRKLSTELDKSGSPKAAAALLTARRANRR
jgi:hypothetical protein